MNQRRWNAVVILAWLLQLSGRSLFGQGNEIIYSNSLQNGWADWSWSTDNLNNTNPVLTNFSHSISVSCDAYGALSLHQTPASSAPYASVMFWANGGDAGGQVLSVTGTLNGASQALATLPPLAPNTWTQFTLSLASIGVANQPNFDGIWIWNYAAKSIPVFYIDDIILQAAPAAPAPVISPAARCGDSFTFTWSALTNQKYQIQTATNLDQPSWINSGGILVATNSTMTVSSPATNLQQFYRVALVP